MTESYAPEDIQQMIAALEWQIAMGADENIGEEAFDAFAVSARQAMDIKAKQRQESRPRQLRSEIKAAPVQQVQSFQGSLALAIEAARQSQGLEELFQAIKRFDGCSLKRTADNTLFGTGPQGARVMILTGQPSAEEDISGQSLSGNKAALFENMLRAIGLEKDKVYYSPTIFWRPPGDKKPTKNDLALCKPFVERQIELVAPKFLLLMGELSSRLLFEAEASLLKSRQNWKFLSFGALRRLPTLTTLSLELMLRMPLQKALVWEDLLLLKKSFTNESH